MRKLFYMGLEPYESRYTLQLTDWSERAFKRRGVDYVIVPGQTLDNSKAIVTGQVLDAHGRSYYALTQMANLVQMMRNGEVSGGDAIFFEDMFQPGIEALPYIMNQIEWNLRPKVWVRCLAQTIDPDDFTNSVIGMKGWMSKYEKMVNEFVTGVLCSNEEMVAHANIAGWRAPLYNISGLSFDQDEVREWVEEVKPWHSKLPNVVFAARWDQEKQPDFFMDLAERMQGKAYFQVLQGGPLRSNNEKYIKRARRMQDQGKLFIRENLTKSQYYFFLNNAKVLFNCALQDWTSNTVSEADALRCNVLYPAYRSFPEVFANDHERMYIPWSLDDAEAKLTRLLEAPHPNMGKIADWNSKTIDRMIDIMSSPTGGSNWDRNYIDYRERLFEPKYS